MSLKFPSLGGSIGAVVGFMGFHRVQSLVVGIGFKVYFGVSLGLFRGTHHKTFIQASLDGNCQVGQCHGGCPALLGQRFEADTPTLEHEPMWGFPKKGGGGTFRGSL